MHANARTLTSWRQAHWPRNPVRFGRAARNNIIFRFLVVWIFLAALTNPEKLNARIDAGPVAATEIAVKPTYPAIFRSVGKGYRSGVRLPLQAVARSQNEWDAIWQQHLPSDAGARPAPSVDFEREIVVALFLGDKPSGGYDVRISRAEQSHGTLTIHYQERNPPSGGMVTQPLSQPFHIVRIIGEVTSAVVFHRDS